MEKNSKIYVAGHRGLVGSAIVRALQKEGYTNLVLRSSSELNLTNQAAVEFFFKTEKPNYVFLAAAKVGGIAANQEDPVAFARDNLLIQTHVMDSAAQHGVKKLLFLGSSCTYPRLCNQPMKEEYLFDGKLEPTNQSYAVAKLAGIQLCKAYTDSNTMKCYAIQPPNLYGEGDHFDGTGHVIGMLMHRMHKAKINNDAEVVVWGTGNARREFMYVDDAANAAIFTMQNGLGNNIFLNTGTSEDVSIRELAEIIQKTVGFKGTLSFDTTKPDGMPQKLLDSQRFLDLGWTAKTSLKKGLQLTYNYYLNAQNKAAA